MGTVLAQRARLTALLLLGALIATSGAPVIAAHMHPVCTAKQHDCGKTVLVTKCCCGDQGALSTPGQTESITRMVPDVASLTAVFVTAATIETTLTVVRLQASTPRAAPLDLPTLFASLLL